MWFATTWPYRRETRASKPAEQLAGAGRLGTTTSDTAATVAPTAPTEDRPSLDDYAGLPAEGQLGFEQSNWEFVLEIGGDAQPTPEGRFLVGTIRALTGGYESPSAYYLEEGHNLFDLDNHGNLWWISENFPTYADRLFPAASADPSAILGPIAILAGARLRDQRVRTNITITPEPLTRHRIRDALGIDATGRPVLGVQDAAWDYTQTTPVTLAGGSFQAVWTIITNFQWVQNVWNFVTLRWDRIAWDNPFRSDDLPLEISFGGVVMATGRIPLKDMFIDRFPDNHIYNYEISIADSRLGATIKPYGPPVARVFDSSTAKNGRIQTLRRAYGPHAVWWPLEAHPADIHTTITITAYTKRGDSFERTFQVKSLAGNSNVPLMQGTLSFPSYATVSLGDARMQMIGGTVQSDDYIDPGSPYYDFEVDMANMPVSDTILFQDWMQEQLQVFDTASYGALSYIVRGKFMAWAVSWITESDSETYYLFPGTSSLYQYLPGEAFALLQGTAYGTRRAAADRQPFIETIGTATLSGVFSPDSPGNIAQSFGPHLTLKAHSRGVFRFIATENPGTTIIQIAPYVHEWYAWLLPIPGLAKAVNALIRRLGSWGMRSISQSSRRGVARTLQRINRLDSLSVSGWQQVTQIAAKRNLLVDRAILFQKGVGKATESAATASARLSLDTSAVQATRQVQTSLRLQEERQANPLSDRVTTGFQNLQFEGLVGPPIVGAIVWEGDYVCGRLTTLPKGELAG